MPLSAFSGLDQGLVAPCSAALYVTLQASQTEPECVKVGSPDQDPFLGVGGSLHGEDGDPAPLYFPPSICAGDANCFRKYTREYSPSQKILNVKRGFHR